MGGIAGAVVEGDGAARPGGVSVDAFLDAMPWRGPAGRGRAEGPGGGIGHLLVPADGLPPGHPPVANEDETLWAVLDGRILNREELVARLQSHRLRTPADAEVVLHLFEEEGPRCLRRLRGPFALAVWDRRGRIFLARDPLGVKPLYWARGPGGQVLFASEMKALLGVTDQVAEFPPGHWYRTGAGLHRWYRWPKGPEPVRDPAAAIALVRRRLVEAVDRCLAAPVPVGVFLSGGLDSSLVAAVARRLAGPGLKTFAVGMAGSLDLAMARRVAAYLGTDHHEYAYTPEEVRAALPRVIDHLESFDVPLVRSAVGTYFAAALASRHVQVVLTGEGADELFAGYHYLKGLPGPGALGAELRRITQGMHNTGLQRVDRETMAHGLEARLPFLDLPLVEAAAAIDPAILLGPDGQTEKWLLRRVAEEFLPPEIAGRRKEKFSLGTGTGQYLERLAEETVPDADLERDGVLPSGGRVGSKEELLYWRYFRDRYGRPGVVRDMGRSRTIGDWDPNPAGWRSA
ncbi:MAG: asparagine synthase-related protein [Bacillota bacterium]|nr:MAG: asparagine synthetase B [Bacillota bacterium]